MSNNSQFWLNLNLFTHIDLHTLRRSQSKAKHWKVDRGSLEWGDNKGVPHRTPFLFEKIIEYNYIDEIT